MMPSDSNTLLIKIRQYMGMSVGTIPLHVITTYNTDTGGRGKMIVLSGTHSITVASLDAHASSTDRYIRTSA